MKNLLDTELEFKSNLEVSSQLLHNLKSIFMKLLITLELKNTHAKFPDLFLRAFLYNRVIFGYLTSMVEQKAHLCPLRFEIS